MCAHELTTMVCQRQMQVVVCHLVLVILAGSIGTGYRPLLTPGVFAGHCSSDAFDNGWTQGCCCLNMLHAAVNFRTCLPANILTVSTFICILKPSPTTDIVNKRCAEVAVGILNIRRLSEVLGYSCHVCVDSNLMRVSPYLGHNAGHRKDICWLFSSNHLHMSSID